MSNNPIKTPNDQKELEPETEGTQNTVDLRLHKREAELKEHETKLAAIESDLKEFSRQVEKDQKQIEKDKKQVEKDHKKVLDLLKITEGQDAFSDFYSKCSDLYVIWVSQKGSSDGFVEAVDGIIKIRDSMNSEN